MNKKLFYFYKNWAEMLYLLPDDIMAQCMKAILAHSLGKETPDMSAIAGAIVAPIFSKMDEDDEAYTNKCERNRESAARRWQNANASERNANSCERMQTNADIKININTDIDKREEKRGDKREVNKRKDDIERVIAEWNSIPNRMLIPKVSEIKPDTQRYKMLCVRINEYGLEKVVEAIQNVGRSSFLKGNNDRGWTCTLEWFAKPNNFVKVLEGHYNDTKKNGDALSEFLRGGEQ